MSPPVAATTTTNSPASVADARGQAASPPFLPLLLVLVVDVLNECKVCRQKCCLCLSCCHPKMLPARLRRRRRQDNRRRIFFTSRPEEANRARLHTMPASQQCHVILHHLDWALVSFNISLFFGHGLAVLLPSRTWLPEFTDDEVLEPLVERAYGLFIWAATAC
jgi:hypothetical protein